MAKPSLSSNQKWHKQLRQEYSIIQNSTQHLFKHSEVAQWKYEDYIAHKEASVVARNYCLERQVMVKKEQAGTRTGNVNSKAVKTLQNIVRNGNTLMGDRSFVLSQKTIWCHGWKEEESLWPSLAEFMWEGDTRAQSGFGRYLPLLRGKGTPNIPWNESQIIIQYPLDQVARIPTMEDIYFPVDEIDDDIKYSLINESLEEATDNLEC